MLRSTWVRLRRLTSSYLSVKEQSTLERAYCMAKEIHRDERRVSGQAVLDHVTNVAFRLAEINLGIECLVAALLHESVDRAHNTESEITQQFGDDIGFIVLSLGVVKGLTKTMKPKQETFGDIAHLLAVASKDIRVLIIRLAVKLEDLSTVQALPPSKQAIGIKRAEGIYAPLCELIGLHHFKREYDDLCLSYYHPKAYSAIKEGLQKYYDLADIESLLQHITNLLDLNHIRYTKVYGRTKGIASAYNKIERYKRTGRIKSDDTDPLSRIWDKMGVTILTERVSDCYIVLGILMQQYATVQQEFDDYIAHPKKSGYQSLQIPILLDHADDVPLYVEVQIKTAAMHENNEFGSAAHFAYKSTVSKASLPGLAKQLHRWQDHALTASTRQWSIDVLQDKVFVFTKGGDIVHLPKGATPLDFAYTIHTDLGNHCRGALVNGKIVPLSYTLETGQQIEILESKKPMVNKGWLEWVRSERARREIRQKT